MQQKLLKKVEDMAARNLKKLDELPEDVGGRIRELTDYDFMDEEARQQFEELMDTLKKHAMQSYGRDLIQKIKDMDARSLAGMRHMVEALNQMLEQRLKGEQPDFEGFMEERAIYLHRIAGDLAGLDLTDVGADADDMDDSEGDPTE